MRSKFASLLKMYLKKDKENITENVLTLRPSNVEEFFLLGNSFGEM